MTLTDRHQMVSDSLQDFGSLAFDAIHRLQQRIRELEAENAVLKHKLEKAHRELELALTRTEKP